MGLDFFMALLLLCDAGLVLSCDDPNAVQDFCPGPGIKEVLVNGSEP